MRQSWKMKNYNLYNLYKLYNIRHYTNLRNDENRFFTFSKESPVESRDWDLNESNDFENFLLTFATEFFRRLPIGGFLVRSFCRIWSAFWIIVWISGSTSAVFCNKRILCPKSPSIRLSLINLEIKSLIPIKGDVPS